MSEATTVKAAGTVDITKKEPAVVVPDAPVIDVEKLSVDEYAKKLAAEARGETYTPPESAIVEPAAGDPAAAAAAATAKAEKESAEAAAATALAAENAKKKKDEEDAAALAASETPEKLKEARDVAIADAAKKAAEAEDARKATKIAEDEVARLKTEAEARAAEALKVPKVEDDPVPQRDSFDDPDKFEEAMRGHAARTEIRKASERSAAAAKEAKDAADAKAEEGRKAKAQEQIVALHKTFNERVATQKVDIPDYDVKVTNNEKLILRNDIFFTVEQMDLPAHVLVHLADNPDVAAELNKMPPIAAVMRLGEIQGEIRIARKPKPSAAKPPVKAVGQRASPERKTPDEESMTEYAARRDKEEANARANRKNPRLLN